MGGCLVWVLRRYCTGNFHVHKRGFEMFLAVAERFTVYCIYYIYIYTLLKMGSYSSTAICN